jgi:hypothetical protein
MRGHLVRLQQQQQQQQQQLQRQQQFCHYSATGHKAVYASPCDAFGIIRHCTFSSLHPRFDSSDAPQLVTNIFYDKLPICRVSQQQQQPPEHQELLLQALLAAQPPATPIDWPWRPRDLQVLRAKFNLLVDSSTNTAAAAASGRDRNVQNETQQKRQPASKQ